MATTKKPAEKKAPAKPAAKKSTSKPIAKEVKQKTTKSKKDELESAMAEIAELKAEIKLLKTQLAKANKAVPNDGGKSKTNDPFEGLMVKVCSGVFMQDYFVTEQYYPNGDHRRTKETRYVKQNRKVTLSKEYQLCKYVVTQAQWKAIMGEGFNISKFRGDDLPVTNVSFDEIMQFIEKLNKLTGKTYRLPTEAEWTWAAMGAGKDDDQGKYAGCNNDEDLEQYAWYENNSNGTTHPVGQKKPNELGLYDMSGNVWEVCQDRYVREFNNGDVVDPLELVGQPWKTCQVGRGGSYGSTIDSCRVQRFKNKAYDFFQDGSSIAGFRLAL